MKIRSTLTGLLFLSQAFVASAQSKPNVLLLFIDDMGWRDFSCFGNTEAETPNIDALAAEGIRFHQFYVNAPICSPSRCAITTGQYPQRWNVTSYLDNRTANANRGVANWLDPVAPSLARILRGGGYATGHFGKWHLGGQRDVGDAPLITEYGFDETLTSFEGLGPRILQLVDPYDGSAATRYTLGSDRLGHGPIYWENRSVITKRWADAAVDFMQRAKAEGKPFYVNLWPDDVHSPFYPPRELRTNTGKRDQYLNVLRYMDAQVGELLEHIKSDPELRDNTIILVCSDNGPEDGAGSSAPFRGTKGQLYEGGIRSPLIVWAPGFIDAAKAGTINTTSWFSAIDLIPSLLQVAGVPAPEGVDFDGVPVPDTMFGDSTASRGAALYFRRPPDRDSVSGISDLPDLAMREGKWKLLCEYDGSSPQLYDLESNPSETSNVAGANPSIVQQMVTDVLAWNATMPPAIDQPESVSIESTSQSDSESEEKSPIDSEEKIEEIAIIEPSANLQNQMAVFSDSVGMRSRGGESVRLGGRVIDGNRLRNIRVFVNGRAIKPKLRSSRLGRQVRWKVQVDPSKTIRRITVQSVDRRGSREEMSYRILDSVGWNQRSRWLADALAD